MTTSLCFLLLVFNKMNCGLQDSNPRFLVPNPLTAVWRLVRVGVLPLN